MTIELYTENSYIKECKAQIVSVNEKFIVFEQTIFYPGGGGQPCDKGFIKQGDKIYEVVKVKKIDSEVLEQQESKQSLNEQEQVMLELCLFFEKPDSHSVDMKRVYKLGDQDSIRFVLRAFQVFFEKDTYLFPLSDGGSIIKENQPIEYLNQTDFARYLNEQGVSFTQNKLAVYRSRGKLPKEDMVISGKPYWTKETAEQYVREMKENQE